MKSKPRFTLLFCFLLAGIWCGSVVTYTVTETDVIRTAEVQLTDTAGRFFNRNRDDQPKRTQPYDSESAPPLNGTPGVEVPPAADEPVPDGMAFPAPSTPTTPPTVVTPPNVAVPPAADPTSPTDMLNGVLGSVTKLFNGDGNFSDILNIAMAAFALFGGSQMAGSDSLFKIILGLFSKKANFNAILKDRVDPPAGGRRRRRNRS